MWINRICLKLIHFVFATCSHLTWLYWLQVTGISPQSQTSLWSWIQRVWQLQMWCFFWSPSQKTLSHAAGLMCSGVETKIPHLELLEMGSAGYLGSYTTEYSHRIPEDDCWCSPAFVQTRLQFQYSQQIRNTDLVSILGMFRCHVQHPAGIKAEAGTEYTSPSFCFKYKTILVLLILLCRLQEVQSNSNQTHSEWKRCKLGTCLWKDGSRCAVYGERRANEDGKQKNISSEKALGDVRKVCKDSPNLSLSVRHRIYVVIDTPPFQDPYWISEGYICLMQGSCCRKIVADGVICHALMLFFSSASLRRFPLGAAWAAAGGALRARNTVPALLSLAWLPQLLGTAVAEIDLLIVIPRRDSGALSCSISS